jgi:hypothetical protein
MAVEKKWKTIRDGIDALLGIDREEVKEMVNRNSKEFRAWRDKSGQALKDAIQKFVESLKYDELMLFFEMIKDEFEKRTK